MAKKEISIYTVSQITALVKAALEAGLPAKFLVAGEISDWKIHQASGHCYFSLKDENAVLPCVMWARDFSGVKFKPENGLAVIAKGFIDVYMPRGKYQFNVEKLEPAGMGALNLAFEQLKRRLQAEGLFDEKHKKPLPKFPMRIGIVTSESGAAVHDIADSIQSRWPCAKLFLYPVLVQGEGAADDIAAAINNINSRNSRLKLDILIVGRGGGSLEDLWAFNEEAVARAIFASIIPVISAVGHEVDFTIADFVADKRASTPTKAGVEAVPDISEIHRQLENYRNRLSTNLKSVFQLCSENLATILASRVFKKPQLIVLNRGQQIDDLTSKMRDSLRKYFDEAKELLRKNLEFVRRIEPHRLLGKKTIELNEMKNRSAKAVTAIVLNRQQWVDELTMKMKASVRRYFDKAKELLRKNMELVLRIEPHRLLGKKTVELNEVKNRCSRSITAIVQRNLVKLTAQANRLSALNPKSVLNRGYSITTNKKTGLLIKKADDVEIGDIMITELAEQNLIESKTIKK